VQIRPRFVVNLFRSEWEIHEFGHESGQVLPSSRQGKFEKAQSRQLAEEALWDKRENNTDSFKSGSP